MVKFKKLWLFERSEFKRFLNFIIAQSIAKIIYVTVYSCLRRLSKNSNFFQNQGLLKKLPQTYS